MSDLKRFEGRTVIDVIDTTLILDDGSRAVFALDADCCSASYFTDGAQFAELRGATIQSVEERDEDSESAANKAVTTAVTTGGYDVCTKWHFLVFVTDKGHVTIDWRNESNGYYDGQVDVSWKEAANG